MPLALAVSAFALSAVTPLLMLGGAYLCFEGFEKRAHKFLHSKADDTSRHAELVSAVANPAVDIVAFEKDKIRGAIRTDFVLSAEIIVITLGTIATAIFSQRVTVLSAIAIAVAMTVGVYGFVAAIVKLDDVGLHLSKKRGVLARTVGAALLSSAPMRMKLLSVVGTAAMFLVGGGIISHGIPALHHAIESASARFGDTFDGVAATLADGVVGIAAGAAVLAVVMVGQRIFAMKKTKR